MFNKTIFKNTFKSNFKIWFIITVVLCIMNVALIGVFEPNTITSLTDMVKDTPLSNMLADTSFTGMLSQTFYTLHGIILPLIYIIIVANSLVVSQVDRGSMAYLLSTPIKRITVVITQAIYFITSLFTMILISTLVGFISIQAFHGGVWGTNYTKDVKAASEVLNVDKEDINNDLTMILDNDKAVKEGAKARGIDEDAYTAYLNLKITNNSYKAAAEVLNVDEDEVSENPSIIKENDEAIEAAAKVMGMNKDDYSIYLDKLVVQKSVSSEQSSEMQDKIFRGINAASQVLDVEESDLAADMGQIKENEKALDAAVKESGLTEDMFITIINNQIASNEISADEGIDFDVHDYIMLNLGLFLLMFAISGISFMFSCIFNLSKNYMALGGGIPIAFFLFELMAEVSEDLEKLKYFTINSLFDTHAILDGSDYTINFIILGVIGIVLYSIGMNIFKKKDLPL